MMYLLWFVELKNVLMQSKSKIIFGLFVSEGADPCDTAYQLHKCYHDENPEVSTRI
jgi:hypothetical protein